MKKNRLHKMYVNTLSKQINAFVWLICILLFTSDLYAQSDKKIILDGNKHYNNQQYNEAEKNYQKALQKNKSSYAANYNLANALYKKGNYADAGNYLQGLTHLPVSKDTLAKVYHNLGNTLLKQQKFDEAINAYKNALKHNSTDEDTRYNLAYAQSMLKQQNQNNKNKDNKDNKDNKENNQNQNKDKDKKEDKDKNKDSKNNKNKDNKKDKDKQQEESPKQNQLSKEDAQRMLDALQNDEKNVRDKLKPKTKKGVRVQIEKDW